MERLILPVFTLLLVAGVSGVDYSTVIYDSDLDRHFDIEGWVISDSSQEVEVNIKYNLSFSHKYYNRTQISSFSVVLADGKEGIAGKRLEKDFKLEQGESKPGFGSVSSSSPPDRINRLRFLVNHTGTTTMGNTVEEQVAGSFRYSINQLEPDITSFRTNSSTVSRGEEIAVFAETEGIDNLTIEGRNMTRKAGEFRGLVQVPEDSDDGQTLIGYRLEDGRGNPYTEKINVTVENPPPEINLSYSREVVKGQDAEIGVDVTDDLGLNYTRVLFQGQRYQVKKGKVVLPTSKLYRGSYSFTVEAEDIDGRKASFSRNFSVVGEPTGDDSRDSEEKQEGSSDQTPTEKPEDPGIENETSTGTKSFPGVFIDPIIEFFRSLLG